MKNPALPGLEFICSHTRHEHQRDGGPVQFDHYAIQTLRHKFIRLELDVDPGALHSDWAHRIRTIMVRARLDPGTLSAGTVIRELYNLTFDPLEHQNLLAGGVPKDENAGRIADQLEEQLDHWIERCKRERPG